jgi:5'-3' exoribonuclease 1
MGIPRLYRYIKQQCPNCILDLKRGTQNKVGVDHLYIDGNVVVHKACQKVFNYGNNVSSIKQVKGTDEEAFKAVFNEILFICSIVIPKKSLFFTIDGVAPLCKASQQRQRRYLSETNGKFNTSSISVGTIFMKRLSDYLNIRFRQQLNKEWSHLTVFYSSYKVPGEGEHKMFQHCKLLSESIKENDSHCFVSIDADLIMLSLIPNLKNVLLLRENPFEWGNFSLIDIDKLKELITTLMPIDDFILLGFFVGNDFLPKIKMFMFLEDGMDLLKRVYKEKIIQNGKIDSESFYRFIDRLSSEEETYLYSQSLMQSKDIKFRDNTLLKSIHSERLDFKSYRNEYYKKMGIVTEEEIQRLCREYYRGVLFVYLYYYTNECPSWRWFYPYHYAPLMCDFKKTVKQTIVNDFVLEKPSTPFLQLLTILPSKSKELLPEKYRYIFDDKKSYPEKFSIDFEGKTQDYEGVVLLPFINIENIQSEYDKVKVKYYRNTLEKPFYLSKTDKKIKYISGKQSIITNVKKIYY